MRRAWIWIGVIVLSIGVVAAGLIAAVESAADKAWSEFLRDQAARRAAFDAELGDRPPVAVMPSPGNAWTGYTPALEKLIAIPEGDRRVLEEAAAAPAPPEVRARGIALLPAAEPHLATIRIAARAAVAKLPLDVEKGWNVRMPHIAQARFASRVLALSASARLEAGNVDGALDESEVALQLASDTMHVPAVVSGLIGASCIAQALDVVKEIAVSPGATPSQLARIEGMLRRIDERLVTVPRLLETERLFLGQTLILFVEKGEDPGVGPLRLRSWRSLFSFRLMAAETMHHMDRLIDAAREAEPLEWPRVQSKLDGITNELTASHNPLTAITLISATGIARGLRECRARLRVLLAAVLIRRGDRPPSAAWPVDPFPLVPIGHADAVTHWRVWSSWHDGIPSPNGSWSPGSGEDLRLDVPK